MAEWLPRLTSDETPLNPYRVIWDLMHTVDRNKYDHHPRCRQPDGSDDALLGIHHPLSYIGWGQTTHLGFGLGFGNGSQVG